MTRRMAVALGALVAWMGLVPPADAHPAGNFFVNAKWVRDTSVNYSFTPSAAPSADWRTRTVEAANAWNALAQPMTFTPAPDLADFDPFVCPSTYQQNGVHRRRIDGGGGTLAQAITCWYGGTKELSTFQLIYDDSENWYLGTGTPGSNQPDLLSVAVHELGHATGFSKHFGAGTSICALNSKQQTMCPTHLLGSTWQRTLEKHDKHTFSAAY